MTITHENKSYEVPEIYLNDNKFMKLINHDEQKAIKLLASSLDNHITLTDAYVKKLYESTHRKNPQAANDFIHAYKNYGVLDKLTKYQKHADKYQQQLQELEHKFIQKFHRVPRIFPYIKEMYVFLSETTDNADKIFQNFNINRVQRLLENISPCETILLYTFYPNQCETISRNIEIKDAVCFHLFRALSKENESLRSNVDWIVNHLNINPIVQQKIIQNIDNINDLNADTVVDTVKMKLERIKAEKEVKKIEKIYQPSGFKLSDCKCTLKNKNLQVTNGRYVARILDATDPLQTRLGQLTDCCQHLYEAGESAMMYGLVHDAAGFMVIEEKNSGIIKAQAEIWEKDQDTLVLDNIEFANDADIGLYREILGEWVHQLDYKNVIMGTGYNELCNNESGFPEYGSITPNVTPKDLYVISYEIDGEAPILESIDEAARKLESGEITYFDYVYCDSERTSVYLKQDGRMVDYFNGLTFQPNRQEEILSQINIQNQPLITQIFKDYCLNHIEDLIMQENTDNSIEDEFELE